MKYQDPFKYTAEIYDLTCRYVPYDTWANHVHRLFMKYGSLPVKGILELSAGTGSFRSFFNQMDIKQYTLCDLSLNMLKGARTKLQDSNITGNLVCADNLNLPFKRESYDAVICLFDSINYIFPKSNLMIMLTSIAGILKQNGILIFDFTTPANSTNHGADDFSEQVEDSHLNYERISHYNRNTGIHKTIFKIVENDQQNIEEVHSEYPYLLKDMKNYIKQIPEFVEIEYLDEFELDQPATEMSERIHVILRKKYA